jgi:tRNA(fMet)-specific endonuclease VapC
VKLLLDTSAYSALVRGDQTILDLLSRAVEVSLPVVAIGELLSGFYGGSRRAENIAKLELFLGKPSVTVSHLTAETAIRYAEVDHFLRTKGKPIPRNDVWIAAIALEHGLPLVALDKHFREIPMLLIRP